jgi:hypothetical protein
LGKPFPCEMKHIAYHCDDDSRLNPSAPKRSGRRRKGITINH